MKSAQSVFNKVIRHLRRQGVRSVDGHRCLYRGPDGTSCAVGCLIPDELYDPSMEGQGVGSLIYDAEHPKTVQRLLGPRLLLEELQNLHDEYMREGWNDECETEAQRIADKFGLEMPE